jgi:uncharacterized membrane protein YuzA (DUF378 family)
MAVHRNMNAIDWIAMVLLIIGGLNWGLVGLFQFDVVATIFGDMSALSRAIYVAVGLAALWSLYTAMKLSRADAVALAERPTYSGPERRRVDVPYTGRDRRMATY